MVDDGNLNHDATNATPTGPAGGKKANKTTKSEPPQMPIPTKPQPFIGLLQHMVLGCPDRGDFRTSLCENLIRMLTCFDSRNENQSTNVIDLVACNRLLPFLEKLLLCDSPSIRAIGIEVLGVLLETCLKQIDKNDPESGPNDDFLKICWDLILAITTRSRDVVPSVRSRALQSLANILDEYLTFLPFQVYSENNDQTSSCSRKLEVLEGISTIFRNGISDAKPLVRKSALEYIDVLLPSLLKSFIEEIKVSKTRSKSEISEDSAKPQPADQNFKTVSKTVRLLAAAVPTLRFDEDHKKIVSESDDDSDFENLKIEIKLKMPSLNHNEDSDLRDSSRESQQDIVVFDIEEIVAVTADESVMVRKRAIQSLSLLLELHNCKVVRQAWGRTILPAIVDVEPSISERAL